MNIKLEHKEIYFQQVYEFIEAYDKYLCREVEAEVIDKFDAWDFERVKKNFINEIESNILSITNYEVYLKSLYYISLLGLENACKNTRQIIINDGHYWTDERLKSDWGYTAFNDFYSQSVNDVALYILRTAGRLGLKGFARLDLIGPEDYDSNCVFSYEKHLENQSKKATGIDTKGTLKDAPKKVKPTTLLEAWLGEEGEYKNVIDFLKRVYLPIDSPFVKEISGRLYWNKPTGFAQFLAGFYWALIEKGWISGQHSSTVFQTISLNTFNIELDKKPFKRLDVNPPEEEYTRPFEKIRTNI